MLPDIQTNSHDKMNYYKALSLELWTYTTKKDLTLFRLGEVLYFPHTSKFLSIYTDNTLQ